MPPSLPRNTPLTSTRLLSTLGLERELLGLSPQAGSIWLYLQQGFILGSFGLLLELLAALKSRSKREFLAPVCFCFKSALCKWQWHSMLILLAVLLSARAPPPPQLTVTSARYFTRLYFLICKMGLVIKPRQLWGCMQKTPSTVPGTQRAPSQG